MYLAVVYLGYLSAIASRKNTDYLGARTFDLAYRGNTGCGFRTNLRRCAKVASPQMCALDFFRLEYIAHDMRDGIECRILTAEIDVERYMTQIRVNVKCEMTVRQQCHQGDMTVFLYICDRLQRNEIKCRKCFGEFDTKGFFIAELFAFAVKKIHRQQSRLNVHQPLSPPLRYVYMISL